MTRVYSYLRVSSKGQVEKDGLPRQREAIRIFCEQHKLDYCGEFAEKGVPGKTEGASRPAWSDMLDRIQNRRDNGTDIVEAVVIERMDRLARCLITSEMLLTTLRDRQIKIFATDQGLIDIASNDGDPTQKLIRQVISAVAEFSKSELVKKLRLSRERAAHRRGEPYASGWKPYGWLPGESAIQQLVVNQRAAGLSWNKLLEYVNSEGLKNREGNFFCISSLRSICRTAHKQRKALCTDQQQSDS